MSKVIMSPGMKHLVGAKYERVTANCKKILWIFSGTPPTKAQIEALVQANGTIMSNALKALGTLRLSTSYPATVTMEVVNASLKKWALEQYNASFTLHSPGPASWFVFMMAQTTINEPTYSTNAIVYQAYIGDMGDIGSGADMEVLTGLVESDKVYKIGDIEVRTI